MANIYMHIYIHSVCFPTEQVFPVEFVEKGIAVSLSVGE